MKLNVGKVVDNMIQGSCIFIDFVKSGDNDYFSLIHNIETGTYVDSDKTNSAYLVGKSYEMPG